MTALVAFLNQNPHELWLIAIVLGLILGSFLNVVIYRLPHMLQQQWREECELLLAETAAAVPEQPAQKASFNLALPRSHCPQCQHTLAWWENVPVISYLLLRGKCRGCKHPISWQYPLVEILSALFCFLTVDLHGLSALTLPTLIMALSLLVLAGIDLKHQLLPDNITLPLLWLGLFFSLFDYFSTPSDAIIGALAGYLSLWLVNQLFKWIAHKEGMGYGDFKLLAAFGAWFGWQALPLLILISAGCGTVIGISLILLKRHQRQQPIPFGPFLALAAWIFLFLHQPLMTTYYHFLGFN